MKLEIGLFMAVCGELLAKLQTINSKRMLNHTPISVSGQAKVYWTYDLRVNSNTAVFLTFEAKAIWVKSTAPYRAPYADSMQWIGQYKRVPVGLQA